MNLINKQILYPKIITRLFALQIDLIIVTLFTKPILKYLNSGYIVSTVNVLNSDMIKHLTFSLIFNYLFVGIYFIGFWYYYGTTIGKIIVKARLVNIIDYGKPKFWQLILRYCCFILGPISLITMLFDNKRQALHDKVAGTIVIKI